MRKHKWMKSSPKWTKAKKWTLSEDTKRRHSEAMKAVWARHRKGGYNGIS